MDTVRYWVDLVGTLVDKVDVSAAAGRISELVEAERPPRVITANLDFLQLSSGDRSFRELVNSADLVLLDSMPLIWAFGFLGDPLPQRMDGVDPVCKCIRFATANDFSVFTIGATPGVAQRVAEVLSSEVATSRIAGIYSSGAQDGDENERTLEQIQAAAIQPDG